MRFNTCKECLNFTKRLQRCKLKSELITTNKGRCAKFSPYSDELKRKIRNQDKNVKKTKDAKTCIGCQHNENGFCKKHKRFASFARKECKSLEDQSVNKLADDIFRERQEELKKQTNLVKKV